MSESNNSPSIGSSLLPFSLMFPLLCIGFGGCWEDGCQGALNAQPKAANVAVKAGGW